MSSSEPSGRGLASTLKKVGRFFCMGSAQVSDRREPALPLHATTKPSTRRTAQVKAAAEGATEAQLRTEIAQLLESLAAVDARAPSDLVEKVIARACLTAAEEARAEDKVVAEAAIAQLQTELGQLHRDYTQLQEGKVLVQRQNDQLQEDKGELQQQNDQLQQENGQLQQDKDDLDAMLQQSRSAGLRLMRKLNLSTEEHQQVKAEMIERIQELSQENAATRAELQAQRSNNEVLCQQYQHLHAQYSLEVNMLREANAARLAEVERNLHAAVREAAMARQQMQATLAEAERIEQEGQQREAELEETVREQAERIEEQDEKVEEQREEIEDLKSQVAELEADQKSMHEDAAKMEADYLRQLDVLLMESSTTPARSLADCHFMEALGKGAQASVDLHEMDGIPVAVKKPTEDEDWHSLLLEERALARMCHRAIPRPLAWLKMDDGNRALAMAAYSGGSLRDMLRPEEGSGKTPMRPSMEWGMARIAEGAEALQYVHSMGRVHQDIKPGNLMLDANGQLVIIDWGNSYLTSDTPRSWCGTPGYLRPLTAAFPERAGPEDDIRGLCAVGLELATGEAVMDLLETEYQFVRDHEQTKETIGKGCRQHGLCPYDYRDRILMAEYLGLISIEEEQFESIIEQEGAPRDYLRLLLRALSQPVACGEEPMPTLQEILDAIRSYLPGRA